MANPPAKRGLTGPQLKYARILANTRSLAEAKLAAREAKLPARKIDEWTGDPAILAEAEHILRVEQSAVRRMRIVQTLETIAFTDASDLFTTDRQGRVTLKPFNQLTPEQRILIQSLKITPTAWGRTTDVKLLDKMAALNLLSRIEGLAQDGANISIKNGVQVNNRNGNSDEEQIKVSEIQVTYVHAPQGMEPAEGEGPYTPGTEPEYRPLTRARQIEGAAAQTAGVAGPVLTDIEQRKKPR